MSPIRTWVFSPQSGGSAVPPALQNETRARIERHANRKYRGRFSRIDVRFHGKFCYVDAYLEPPEPTKATLRALKETRQVYLQRRRTTPMHLVRMRYFKSLDRWSVAVYTYSNERYEPTLFRSGEHFGRPEEAFEVGAVYVQ